MFQCKSLNEVCDALWESGRMNGAKAWPSVTISDYSKLNIIVIVFIILIIICIGKT
jgi:hypothetical protein